MISGSALPGVLRNFSFIPAVLLAVALLAGVSSGAQTPPPKAEKKPVTITSDTMEANKNENVVIFKGNVMAEEDFTLCSDELMIRYDENRDVSAIDAMGNVRIFQGNKVSTAAKATYNRKDRTIVLTGEPQVRQCTDVVKGDRITVYLDDENALVEGNKGRVRAVIMPDKKCPEGNAAGGKDTRGEEARCKGPR